MIISWLTLNKDNIAEQICRATSYFPEFFPQVTELSNAVEDRTIFSQGPVIFGASGLLNNNAAYMLIDALKYKQHPFIAWGIGANHHEEHDPVYPEWLKQFDLVGLRDKTDQYSEVPCPTCLHPAFDIYRPAKTTHRVVFYSHLSHPLANVPANAPHRTNCGTAADVENVIKFLAQGRTVVTNSYHGMYWACLLNRQVMVINPWSSKFYAFKESVSLFHNDYIDLEIPRQNHKTYLEKCRQLNRDFAVKVSHLVQ